MLKFLWFYCFFNMASCLPVACNEACMGSFTDRNIRHLLEEFRGHFRCRFVDPFVFIFAPTWVFGKRICPKILGKYSLNFGQNYWTKIRNMLHDSLHTIPDTRLCGFASTFFFGGVDTMATR